MFDHIGLKVKNPDVSARFYKAVLAPLVTYRIAPERGSAPRMNRHCGCTRPQIRQTAAPTWRSGRQPRRRRPFPSGGLKAGGRDTAHGVAHRLWPAYYAAFLLDPDGTMSKRLPWRGVDR